MIAYLARAELRERWRTLVVLGLLAGVVGGVAAGTSAVARRTSTAYERLERTTHVDDARGTALSNDAVAALRARPEVAELWAAPFAVGRVEGEALQYLGFIGGVGGAGHPIDLARPVAIQGRLPSPTATDEIVVTQAFADLGIEIGDEYTVRFITDEEFTRFDDGFGEPDGPTRVFRVVGVVRLAGNATAIPGVFTSAGLDGDDGAPGALGVGTIVFLRAAPGITITDLQAMAAELQAEFAPEAGAEEFLAIELFDAFASRAAAAATARLLVGGLLLVAGVVAVAGLVVLAQALGRANAAASATAASLLAIGCTRREHQLARAAASAVGATVAGATTFVAVLLAGRAEALGSLRAFEPHPGWAPNLVLAGSGALGVGVAFGTMATLIGTRDRRDLDRQRPSTRSARAPWRTAFPVPVSVGIDLAVGAEARRTRRASTVLGLAVGIGGMAAALVFAASLDRLLADHARYGERGEVEMTDLRPEQVAPLLADPRVADVIVSTDAPVELDGVGLAGQAPTSATGTLEWTLLEGRPPATVDEVVLGIQAAGRLHVGVGDIVRGRVEGAGDVELRVAGVGVLGRGSSGEEFGTTAAFTRDGLARVALAQPFNSSSVRLVPGTDAAAFVADYADEVETFLAEPPETIADLAQVRALPRLLVVFLAFLSLAALAHPLVVLVRRRSGLVAALRSLGFGDGQLRSTLVASAVATAGAAVLIGLPLGTALGSAVWSGVATSAGVAGDPDRAPLLLAGLGAGLGAVAIAAGLVASVPVVRLRPGPALRRPA